VEVFVHEAEEVPEEENGGQDKSDNSNEVYTALDWEAKAEGVTLSELISAHAVTAAAFLQNWLWIWIIL
jgi:hypothetical protein